MDKELNLNQNDACQMCQNVHIIILIDHLTTYPYIAFMSLLSGPAPITWLATGDTRLGVPCPEWYPCVAVAAAAAWFMCNEWWGGKPCKPGGLWPACGSYMAAAAAPESI